MAPIRKRPARNLTYAMTGPPHLPETEERETARRDALQRRLREWRPLRSGEIDQLTQAGNTAADWGTVLVTEHFIPARIRGCRFYGLVRIGDMENVVLETEGLLLQAGLYNSTIVACDLGDNVVIDTVGWLAHCVIADEVVIQHVGRMLTTPLARFGHGVLKEGESEAERCWIHAGNANGRRGLLAYDGFRPADAELWMAATADPALHERLVSLTDARFGSAPGYYGPVGRGSVILQCGSIIDTAIGEGAVIDGALRLENLTISSAEGEPTHIGEGVCLQDGIVGFGCHIERGARARRFVLGTASRLDLGARVEDSVIGDNSTVRCCEVLYDVIGPHHIQHHNNSFLVSSRLGGQSNIAAGATIGSDHNSRAADGELVAGRGFWPGLCTSFRFPCRFASFVLVVRGSYPCELDVPLPFSLLAVEESRPGLQLRPGWCFLHNMYAVRRNELKFRDRDRRVHVRQPIEPLALAPDSVAEIMDALPLLELWTGHAALGPGAGEEALRAEGRRLLEGGEAALSGQEVLASAVENSGRPVRIVAPAAGWRIYRAMAHYYAVRAVLDQVERDGGDLDPEAIAEHLEGGERRWRWLSGQPVAERDWTALREAICQGGIDSWSAVHDELDRLWDSYPLERARHGWLVLRELHGIGGVPTPTQWNGWLEEAAATGRQVAQSVRASRAKDLEHPFRLITMSGPEAREAVRGRIEDHPVSRASDDDAAEFATRLDALRWEPVPPPPAGG